jgi:hypothetical protein
MKQRKLLHEKQVGKTCTVQAINNAAQQRLITVGQALSRAEQLNANECTQHHTKEGISIAAVQAALQQNHGSKYVLRRVKRITERTAPVYLCKQSTGRYMALEWSKTTGEYHWIAVLCERKLVIDGAMKRQYSIQKLHCGKNITRVYEVVTV